LPMEAVEKYLFAFSVIIPSSTRYER